MSNSLDPDQARRIVGPDLGPNCLPRLSADDTGRQRVNISFRWVSAEKIRCVFDDNSKIIFCHIFIKNLCCGCSLESPQRGDSNEHPQHRFRFL